MKSLNLKASRPPGIARADWRNYYFDSKGDFRPEGVAEFACRADEATGGLVIRRLEAFYDEIYIDEFQDLAGYDLDFLDLLFASKIRITAVGDPRQHTYSTNRSRKNKQYRGHAMLDWLQKRAGICKIETRAESWRCNQAICDWADALYPELSKTSSIIAKPMVIPDWALIAVGAALLLAAILLRVLRRQVPPSRLWERTHHCTSQPSQPAGKQRTCKQQVAQVPYNEPQQRETNMSI